MSMLTLFVDASHCPNTRAAGWGAWAIRDGWPKGIVMGGRFKLRMERSHIAEMCGMANAVIRLYNDGHLNGITQIMLQSDCMMALELMNHHCPDAEVRNHQNGAIIRNTSRKGSATERKAVNAIREVLGELKIKPLLRHVRGHKTGDGRQGVNELCDKIAKQHMNDMRAALRAKSGNIEPIHPL